MSLAGLNLPPSMLSGQKLSEAADINEAKNYQIDNANQSQYILGQLGRFVAWAGSGSAAASAVSGS